MGRREKHRRKEERRRRLKLERSYQQWAGGQDPPGELPPNCWREGNLIYVMLTAPVSLANLASYRCF